MQINILVTGANGQLGSELHYLSKNATALCKGFTFLFADRQILDIANKANVKSFCSINNITHIINCAAYTAVDKAESEPEHADLINNIAVKYIAEVAKAANIAVIHISTDYVFDGTNHKPYLETDPTNPQSVYGQTKLDGENALRAVNPNNSIIIRTSWVYSGFGNNFVKTMLRLGRQRDELSVIYDQVGTPTNARDLAQAILQIIPQLNNSSVETYHFANEGVCSWYDFAIAIFENAKIKVKVKPIETKDYPTPAKRPSYSLLNKGKIKTDYSLNIPYWRHSLISE